MAEFPLSRVRRPGTRARAVMAARMHLMRRFPSRAATLAATAVSRGRRRAALANIGIETKFYDTSLVGSALTAPTDASGGEKNPSATISLNTVVQGDGESQRDGRQITMKSLQLKGSVRVASQSAQATADNATKVFIAVVLDTQTNGALLNSEDVYHNPSANALMAADPFRDLQFSKRFRVLATRSFVVQSPSMTNDTGITGGIVQSGLIKNFSMFVNLRNIRTLYSGTTETIANITDNGLNVIAFCNGTALAPVLDYNARLRFVG